MTVAELGHVKDKTPGHGVGSAVVCLTWNRQVGRRDLPISNRGVLSGIVLRDGESPSQGEGPDGST